MADTLNTLFAAIVLKTAVSVNGRLYFNAGSMHNGVPQDGRVIRLHRGKSKHFVFETSDSTIRFEDIFERVPQDVPVFWYRNLIQCGAVDTGRTMKRFALLANPVLLRMTPYEMMAMQQSYLRSVIVDGYIISDMSKATFLDGEQTKTITLPTANELSLDSHDDYVLSVMKDWSGSLYRMGKFVYASSPEQAEKIYEGLREPLDPTFETWWSGIKNQRSVF